MAGSGLDPGEHAASGTDPAVGSPATVGTCWGSTGGLACPQVAKPNAAIAPATPTPASTRATTLRIISRSPILREDCVPLPGPKEHGTAPDRGQLRIQPRIGGSGSQGGGNFMIS